MPIGEFGGAPTLPTEGGPVVSNGMYWLYEMSHAALNPARAFADVTRLYLQESAQSAGAIRTLGKTLAASAEMFERFTRRYGKPDWNISDTLVGGERVPVHITPVWERPFCRLLHFERVFAHAAAPAAAASS